jgi:uncharacterized protein YbbC (DUF1343 family)
MLRLASSSLSVPLSLPPLLALLLALLAPAASAMELGIDRLESRGFDSLKGKRVGLITNQTGVNSAGRRTREILAKAKGVNLAALFTPEHGLDGKELAGKYVANRKDPVTGVTAHSLYGPTRKPTPEMLKGLDVLIYDMQDIGVRSYTYVSTMARCMEAAGECGLEFMVLDRPNPLGGVRVEGPPVEPQWISFVGQLPVPYVHGMTCGELARMLNDRKWMSAQCKLTVVKMQGWERPMVWRDTGLPWVQTSPNIPRADSPAYYVATGIVGSLAGLETGVGGPNPFEICAGKGVNPDSFSNTIKNHRGRVQRVPVGDRPQGQGGPLRAGPGVTGGNQPGLQTGPVCQVTCGQAGYFLESIRQHHDPRPTEAGDFRAKNRPSLETRGRKIPGRAQAVPLLLG